MYHGFTKMSIYIVKIDIYTENLHNNYTRQVKYFVVVAIYKACESGVCQEADGR